MYINTGTGECARPVSHTTPQGVSPTKASHEGAQAKWQHQLQLGKGGAFHSGINSSTKFQREAHPGDTDSEAHGGG